MKRNFPLIFLLALSLLLTACGPQEETRAETDLDAAAILQVMADAAPGLEDGMDRYTGLDGKAYAQMVYGISAEEMADAAALVRGGVSALELSVLQLTADGNADQSVQSLQEYLRSRQGDFTGYAPEQAELVSGGLVLSSGRWLALVICQDPGAVEDAFAGCFHGGTAAAGAADAPQEVLSNGRVAFDPPLLDDMTLYDTTAILSAWEGGGPDALSEYDRTIYDRAAQVLRETLSDGMSGYEKERALYNWMVAHVVYDYDHYDPAATLSPDSSTPYGPLVTGKGICLGFATTFQLLMDMADVECITVVGASFRNAEDHAWNMVRLNGQWYCADTTWDSGGGPRDWSYFNVTSDWMAQTDHQWDYDAVPEATATDAGTGEGAGGAD